ncbi:MAG: hypothetical protein LBS14_00835 [Holosporaceae bacterium]|nr:hypothetical protein [Holosporaceae bacterium]
MLDSIISIFSFALAFTLVGLNIYLSTRVLNVTDLTCDASVAIGGCSYGALVVCGVNPLISILISACLGIFSGFMTSCFISHIKINQVLASVITLSVLKTFILKLASVGNNVGVKELAGKSIMSPAASSAVLAVVVVATVCIFLVKILRSEYGLAMRVYGNGEVISESLGINTNGILLIGLGIGNMLAALAGALIAQIAGTFSVNMGDGSLIFGLAAVIIGEKIIAPSNVFAAISGCFVGSLAYKLIMETANLGGASDLGSEYNNLIMGVVLVLLIAIIQNRGKGVPA